MGRNEAQAALTTLIASIRTSYALGHPASLLAVTGTSSPSDSAVGVLITALNGVSENVITAQQVTDANAALTTLQAQAPVMATAIETMYAAVNTANAALRSI